MYRMFWLSDSEAFGSSLLIGLTKEKPILCLVSRVSHHADAAPDAFGPASGALKDWVGLCCELFCKRY